MHRTREAHTCTTARGGGTARTARGPTTTARGAALRDSRGAAPHARPEARPRQLGERHCTTARGAAPHARPETRHYPASSRMSRRSCSSRSKEDLFVLHAVAAVHEAEASQPSVGGSHASKRHHLPSPYTANEAGLGATSTWVASRASVAERLLDTPSHKQRRSTCEPHAIDDEEHRFVSPSPSASLVGEAAGFSSSHVFRS